MTTTLIICAIIATGSMAAVSFYLVLSFLPQLKRTLNFVESEIKEIVGNLTKTSAEINVELRKVGEAVDNLSTLIKSVQELNDEHIKPMMDTVNQITSGVNRSVHKAEDIADETSRFAKKSLHIAAFYRDKLFVPAVEIVSLWSGIKTAVNFLLKGIK